MQLLQNYAAKILTKRRRPKYDSASEALKNCTGNRFDNDAITYIDRSFSYLSTKLWNVILVRPMQLLQNYAAKILTKRRRPKYDSASEALKNCTGNRFDNDAITYIDRSFSYLSTKLWNDLPYMR